jgi:hypothetical protein
MMFEHVVMNDDDKVEQVSTTIESLFENPPLLKTEDPEKYKRWVDSFACAIQPRDLMECVLLKDYVELEWEVVRYRRMRTALIEGSAREAFKSLLRSVLNRGDHTEEELEKHAASLARDLEANLRGELLSANLSSMVLGVTPDIVIAEVFALRSKEMATLDKMLASAERRRNAALQEIEKRRAQMGRRLREASQRILETETQPSQQMH